MTINKLTIGDHKSTITYYNKSLLCQSENTQINTNVKCNTLTDYYQQVRIQTTL